MSVQIQFVYEFIFNEKIDCYQKAEDKVDDSESHIDFILFSTEKNEIHKNHYANAR
ncbi:unnamed protein product (macronuclear) [Paramecium tetraurelia]|uniref:Uncharacterized protein n=1 Tax=Paramecium tetraurelia TaxID=5888 RepID=A0E2S8_PARTE|nr:uncharacterized protein GSPATT00022767001 [Paramecium tetraurelia]CAK89595.1 unnamed protein product [Paramecium tetraurelia]|eukprot:XP_001456992.1 hypothetical protein (macronuclear) [Paramecium tetraurelia strain d4-2]